MMRYVRRFLRIYQGFIVSGAVLFFGAVALILAVLPAIRATRDLYERLLSLKKENQALSDKRTFLASLSEEDLGKRVVVLLSAVPQEKSVPTIFGTVEGLAVQSGVSIVDMSFISPGSLATESASRLSAAEKKIGASTLPFSLAASGSYDAVRAFVGRINRARRLLDVTSFDLSIDATGVTNVRLSLTAFHQPLPTKVGSVEAPVPPITQGQEDALEKLIQYPDLTQSFSEASTPLFSTEPRDPFAPQQ